MTVTALKPGRGDARPPYLESLTLIERLHRRFLEVLQDELDRHGRPEIGAAQAFLLHAIGDRELTAKELRGRDCFFGTNVSYPLEKLVALGLLERKQSTGDRRTVSIRLTRKGQEVRAIVAAMYERHIGLLEVTAGIRFDDLGAAHTTLRRLDRFLGDIVSYRL
jgi:DNA-binding MarR family transcriptional regulator